MCDARDKAGSVGAASGRPRWGLLYAAVLPQLAGLVANEVVPALPATGLALRILLTLGVLATMSIWVRGNRRAFDLQNWCACAPQYMTIRVIEPGRPRCAALPLKRPVISSPPMEESIR